MVLCFRRDKKQGLKKGEIEGLWVESYFLVLGNLLIFRFITQIMNERGIS